MAGRLLKNGVLCVVAMVFSALLPEFGLQAAAHLGRVEIDINPLIRFWAGINPDFGVWHCSMPDSAAPSIACRSRSPAFQARFWVSLS